MLCHFLGLSLIIVNQSLEINCNDIRIKIQKFLLICLIKMDSSIVLSCNITNHPECYIFRANSRFVPSQWEKAFQCNDVSHWLGASLESDLYITCELSSSSWIILAKIVDLNGLTWAPDLSVLIRYECHFQYTGLPFVKDKVRPS